MTQQTLFLGFLTCSLIGCLESAEDERWIEIEFVGDGQGTIVVTVASPDYEDVEVTECAEACLVVAPAGSMVEIAPLTAEGSHFLDWGNDMDACRNASVCRFVAAEDALFEVDISSTRARLEVAHRDVEVTYSGSSVSLLDDYDGILFVSAPVGSTVDLQAETDGPVVWSRPADCDGLACMEPFSDASSITVELLHNDQRAVFIPEDSP